MIFAKLSPTISTAFKWLSYVLLTYRSNVLVCECPINLAKEVVSIIALAKQFHAYEKVDKSDFQRQARILQSIWREEQGYPIGSKDERLYGARLEMPWARYTLSNFMTETAKNAVRNEVLDPMKSKGKLYGKPRIFDNLLSSQPLCFNLFADLQQNLELATETVQSMGFGQVARVTAIEFEHSPGRGDPEYLGDRSAFDVFIEYQTKAGASGFLGIEVKYHENLIGKASDHRDSYEEVARKMGCFKEDKLPDLKCQPLQQIWRDHLLACSVILHKDKRYAEGAFIFLYPEQNTHCSKAIEKYRDWLANEDGFMNWTLEALFDAIQVHAGESWGLDFYDRYLDFSKINRALM